MTNEEFQALVIYCQETLGDPTEDCPEDPGKGPETEIRCEQCKNAYLRRIDADPWNVYYECPNCGASADIAARYVGAWPGWQEYITYMRSPSFKAKRR